MSEGGQLEGERAFHQKSERALWLSGHVKRESLFPSLRLSGGAHSSRPASRAPLLPLLYSPTSRYFTRSSRLSRPASRSSCLGLSSSFSLPPLLGHLLLTSACCPDGPESIYPPPPSLLTPCLVTHSTSLYHKQGSCTTSLRTTFCVEFCFVFLFHSCKALCHDQVFLK